MRYVKMIALTLFLFQEFASADFNDRNRNTISKDRVNIRETDMPQKLMYQAIEIAAESLELFSGVKDIADFIKIELERSHGWPWQCFVRKGGSLAISAKRNPNYYLSANMDGYSIVLYRTKAMGDTFKTLTNNSKYTFLSSQITPDDKVSFIKVNLPDILKNDAVKIAKGALKFYNSPENIAKYIREKYSDIHEPYWQCSVFNSEVLFGFSVTANNNHFIYFRIQEFWVILFKTKAQ